jgi:hypothetical protein
MPAPLRFLAIGRFPSNYFAQWPTRTAPRQHWFIALQHKQIEHPRRRDTWLHGHHVERAAEAAGERHAN